MYTALSLPKVQKTCELLREAARSFVCEISPLYAVEVFDYKTSNTPPECEYPVFDGKIEGSEKRYWIKADFKTPAALPDSEYFLEISTSARGWDGTGPQLIFYIDGKTVSGLDINHTTVRLEPDRRYSTVCYYYSGNRPDAQQISYRLVKINKRVEKLYYDMLVPFETCRDVYSRGSGEYGAVMAALDRACNLIDLRVPRSAEFYDSVESALDFMEREFYGKLCSTEGKPVVNCIGHTHIDVEWQWDRRQTREKIQRSAATAVNLMEEFPEYKFMLSQPELYRYLKEESPELYDRVKVLVDEGRWEPEGGLYLECDCNLVSGESMVRQFLQGKKFFRDEFGVDSRICFLPDVFGYSAAMPQILKKSGIDYFVTSKISWNDTNTVPYDVFMWEGIDGTEIFSSFITAQTYRKCPPARNTTYVGNIKPAFVYGAWDRFAQKNYCTNVIDTYGYGDGGGGPTREMLEYGKRLAAGLPGMPAARFTTLAEYLETVKADFLRNAGYLKRTPRWVGELYLEYHRGTYTTAASTKRGNRKSELALARTEALSYSDLYFGGSYPYDELYDNWRVVLHNQFHDILPGSSIGSVYDFAEKDYAEVLSYTEKTSREKLSALAERICTEGGVLVYNPTGFERSGEIVIDGETVTLGEKIPSFGYAVVSPRKPQNKVKFTESGVDTPYYSVIFDACGRIVSLFDKRVGREVVAAGGAMNEFYVLEDNPVMYDAWELDEYAHTKKYVLDTPAEMRRVTDGERSGFVISRDYMSSRIEQTVWFYSASPRVDLEHRIDWHEKHQMLKLSFPINVRATEATYEIQFGSVTRPTHKNTSWDSAKFEVCAHRWVDMSEYGYGVALLNDCKYGYSAEGNVLNLTCLKCPSEPYPRQDEGLHEFTCALLPHTGDYREAGVIREAHGLNQPLMWMAVGKNEGRLSESFSLVSVREDAAVIDGIKRAEESEDMIVRIYESFGGAVTAHVRVDERFARAYLCDLMENVERELVIEDGVVELPLRAYEIATLRFAKM